jgi:ABC-type sugar transport system permease subunit
VSAIQPQPTVTAVKPHRFSRDSRRRFLVLAAFLLPPLAVLAVLRIWPMLQAVYLSFTSWDGLSSPEWVGLQNYEYAFQDPTFLQALKNNLLILLAIPPWVIIPLFVAALIYSRVPGWKFFRIAVFLPALLSPVVIGIFFSIMLRQDGAVNGILRSVGLDGITRAWLADSSTALPVVAAIIIWASSGIGVLIFLSALGAVDTSLIDAARVDGASWWQIQKDIVFWQILPVIEFWTVIIVISLFTALFPFIFTLTNGGPGYATYMIDFNIYQEAFGNGSLGYASALGVILFVLVLLLVLLQLRLFRRHQS